VDQIKVTQGDRKRSSASACSSAQLRETLRVSSRLRHKFGGEEHLAAAAVKAVPGRDCDFAQVAVALDTSIEPSIAKRDSLAARRIADLRAPSFSCTHGGSRRCSPVIMTVHRRTLPVSGSRDSRAELARARALVARNTPRAQCTIHEIESRSLRALSELSP